MHICLCSPLCAILLSGPLLSGIFSAAAAEGDVIPQSGFIKRTSEQYPWKITHHVGIRLEKPAESIVIVYNHGSATDDNAEPLCNFRSRLFPISDLAGRRVGKNEIFVYVVCTNRAKGDFDNPEERDFPEAYLCNFVPIANCKPAKYREFKRREQILAVIDIFLTQGVPAKQVFVAGHSCGGWQSLMLMAMHGQKLGGAIALDPGCYGSPAWQAKKPNYRRLLHAEMEVIQKAKLLPSLVFTNESSSCCSPAILQWMHSIPGTIIVQTPGQRDGKFTVNGQTCYLVDTAGKNISLIRDGHRLNYSPCFMHYRDKILYFITERSLN